VPIRLLRPGLTTSRRFNALDWMAQSFYVRLLTLVDDYGRMEADHDLLASLAFPLHRDINCQQIAGICQQMIAQKMALFYEVDGTKYLQLTKWKERARSESRFPDPICGQMTANDSKCLQMIASPPSPSPSPSPSPVASKESAFELLQKLKADINLLYHQPNRQWTEPEERELATIVKRPQAAKECERIIAYEKALDPKDKKFFPQSVFKLVEGWAAMVDKVSKAKQPLKSKEGILIGVQGGV